MSAPLFCILWSVSTIFWIEAARASLDGTTAYAVALKGIRVDGDLSDWPAVMIQHPIRNHRQFYGPTDIDEADLNTSADLSPSFMVGFDPEENLLYLAVRVRDERLKVGGSHHKQTDACEVYVDGDHSGERRIFWPGITAADLAALQYVAIPGEGTYGFPDHQGNPSLFLGEVRRTRMAYARREDIAVYEWAIEVFDHYPDAVTRLAPGKTLGFDVAVVDKDTDADIPAWVCWGPFGGSKYLNADLLGDLVLVETYAALGTLAGEVTYPKTRAPWAGVAIRVEDEAGEPRGRATTGEDGRYQVWMQPGSYRVMAADAEGANPVAVALRLGEEVQHIDFEPAVVGPGSTRGRLDPTWVFKAGVGALLAFSLLHLFLFVFYPKLRENLCYAVFTCCTAAVVFLNYRMDFTVADQAAQLVHQKVFGLAGTLMVAAGMRFLYALFYPRLPRQFWGLVVLGAGLEVWSWKTGNDGVSLFALLVFPEILRVILAAVRDRKEGARIIGIGYLAFVLATTYQVLAGLNILRADVEYTYVYGFLGLLAAVSVSLARNFARANKDLEEQLVQIKELSAQTLAQERRIQEEKIERKLLEEELQTAHELQMGLMPKTAPQLAGFDLAGQCVPANHVGGDFFQYFHPPQGRLTIALADVTGHAMKAAIPAVMFSGILKSQVELGGCLEELFGRLNRSLFSTLDAHTFICFAAGELDLVTRTLRLSNGGCPYPYHYRAATGEVVELQVDAYPLGVRTDTVYQAKEVWLAPGDRVVFCSDGIIEATNATGEMFGFERTGEAIRRGCAEDLSAEALLERLMAEVRGFRGEVPQGDDQTVVVLKVEGQQSI